MKSRSEASFSAIFLPPQARKINCGKYSSLKFRALSRLSRRSVGAKGDVSRVMLLLLSGLWCMLSSVQAVTPYYHLNRSFSAVQFDLQGIPTEYQLNEESDKLTDIVQGTIKIDTTNTYAIEKQMAIPLCYLTSQEAWDAAVAYTGSTSNYPGKTFDNVGWVRGTKNTGNDWGAYLWVIQNQITFQSSTSEWWILTNNLPVAITNVIVGSLGDYGPVSNVVDIGPVIPTNFPGANQNDSGTYQVDITNVFYELVIPDIWITPRDTVTCVGGSNVQFTVTGTNIPQGVTWTIIPSGVGAEIYPSNDWHYAGVTPGNIGTNYKVRATSVDNTNFYDQVDLEVVKIDILETNVYVGISNNITLHLTTDSTPDADWEIIPDLQGGAYFEGSESGASVDINAGSLPTNYTVKAYASVFTNYFDTCTVTVIKAEVTNIKFNHNTGSSSNDAINIRYDYNTAYDISGGEWIKCVTNIPVCYTTNKSVIIKARFTVQPANITNADIWAVSTDSGGSLGNVVKTNVTFVSGVASDVVFQVFSTTPNCVKKTTTDLWAWKIENVNGSGSPEWGLNTSGVHTVYTILDEPVSPWVNTAGNQKNAWTKVLDYSCDWANSATDETNAVEKVTTGAYSGFGKTYNGNQSRTIYNTMCHLSAMMATNVVDCRDMSAVVQLFSRILGGTTVQVRRVNDGIYDGSFNCKPMSPIGYSTWVTNGEWNFHQFGWHANSVNDACIKIKESAPYVPIHDDLNGNYKTNLYDSGTWNPLTPDTVTDFD